MKFKVGDKVRIATNDYEPDLKSGEVVTIYKVTCEEHGYYVETGDDVYWVEECDVKAVDMKGWELLKEIAEENIKEGTKFKDALGNIVYFDGINFRYDNNHGKYYSEDNDDVNFATREFEIIEEQEEINIQEIPEATGTYFDSQQGYNTLLQAIKQLDKKIKEK